MLSKKLSVLSRVAQLFQQENIVWGVGASLLLWHFGITDSFRDIDIVVVREDAARADRILSALGQKSIYKANPVYITEYFSRFVIEDIELDLMSVFGIRNQGCDYIYRFSALSIAMTVPVRSVPVPFTALEDWYILYNVMPRRDLRISQIEQYFLKNGIQFPQILKNAVADGNLPIDIRHRIEGLLRRCGVFEEFL